MRSVLIQFPLMTEQELPNRIREWRKRRDLTQAQLGERVGLSAVHIGHLEGGRREISLSHMRAIARVLEISTADLLCIDDNPLSATPRGQRLMHNWTDADESGRQAIERVAESLSNFRPQEDDTVRRMRRKGGGNDGENGPGNAPSVSWG